MNNSTTTREDKLTLINNLQKNFRHKDELLLPDNELYPDSFNEENLTLAGKKVCVWLGVKPHNLKFTINDLSKTGYHQTDNKHEIIISSELSTNPFIASAVIAISCIEYFMRRKKIEHNTELIELSSVEFGLGLLIVNSFNSTNDLKSKTKRVLRLTKNPSISPFVLSHFSPQEYARFTEEFINKNRLGYRSVTEHMLPWTLHYLHLRDRNIKVLRPTDYSSRVQRDLFNLRIKTIFLSILIMTTLAFGIFLWQHQPRRLPVSLQRQKENIEILEKSYKACMDSARYKQEKYDTRDIFLVRQLDAHIARCKSIRNSHDYSVKQYNQELSQAGF